MQSKIAWVLIAFVSVGFIGSLAVLYNVNNSRNQAQAEAQAALAAKKDADEAAAKAIAARQQAEATRQQADAEIAALKADATVSKSQLSELKDQQARFDADIAGARKALAELQRANPQAATVVERPKPAAIPRHKADGWSVPEMLPPDTLMLATIRDVPVTLAKAKETGLWKICSSPEFARVVRLPVGKAQGYIMMGELLLGEKVSDIADYMSQGEITFAVLGVDKRLPNGAPLADVLIGIQLREKADAFVKDFHKRLDQLKAALGGRLTTDQLQLGDTRVTQLKFADFPGALNCCLCDGTFLVCLGDGRLEKLLAMHEKMKTAKPDPGAKTAEVLSQLPSYNKALERAGDEADAVVWANVEALAANPIVNTGQMNATQRHELELSGLGDVTAVSYSFGIKDMGVRESVFLDVPAGKRKGAIGLIDGESADLKQLYAAPRNAVLAATFKVTPEKLLDKVVELAAIDNPKAREDVAAGLFFLGETLKIDVKKDLINALTGQGVFSVSMPSKNAKLPLAFPQPVLALQVRNKEGLKNLLAAVAVAAQEKFQFSEIKEGVRAITIARERAPENGRQAGQLCFTMDDNDLIVSLYPLALREELRRRANATPGSRLEDDADFNQARANLSGQPQALLYVDTAAVLTAAYDMIAPLAQFRDRDPQLQADFNELPTADLIGRNLSGSLIDLHFAADGIFIEGYSPLGVGMLLLPVAVIVPRFVRANGGIPPMAGAPRAFRQQGQRAEAHKIDALDKLSRDLKEFAAEHNGGFPKTLDEMKPKYLQDLGADLEQIIYLGKQAADNRVVAYSSDKLPGMIAVLLQNGSVRSIARPELGKVLKDGAETTDAVKPPKPPEF